MTAPAASRTLARRTMGPGAASVFAVGSSAPMVVLVGGIPTMYAATGVDGVPLSFVVIAAAVALLAWGYVAMASDLRHPAPFYAFAARGLSPTAGMAAGTMALVSYNAIQISLYGLIGPTLAGVLGGSWQVWAWIMWAVVGFLGFMGGLFAARVLGGFLAIELTVIVSFILAGFTHAAHGITWTGLAPSHLVQPGVFGVLAFAMASYVGVECPAVFAEEGRPRAVARAVAIALAITTVLYLLAAVAYEEWTGAGQVGTAAADPDRQPFALLGQAFGPSMIGMATFLLATSVLASMSAFHASVARYVFGMAREGVLPARFARVSRAGQTIRGGAPLGGSFVQTIIAGGFLAIVQLAGIDPTVMFLRLSTIASVGILTLLVVTAVASPRWFTRADTTVSLWTHYIAPWAGAAFGFGVIVMMLANLSALLGLPPGDSGVLDVPLPLALIAAVGVVWGLILRARRPKVWRGIGSGAPASSIVLDDRLRRVEV